MIGDGRTSVEMAERRLERQAGDAFDVRTVINYTLTTSQALLPAEWTCGKGRLDEDLD